MANGEVQLPPNPIRGPLKYRIETSSAQIEAGREFSVFVTISNPYDVPATIKSVSTRLPAKFLDTEAVERGGRRELLLQQLRKLATSELRRGVPAMAEEERTKQAHLDEAFKSVVRLLPFGSILVGGYSAAKYVTASAITGKADMAAAVVKPEAIDNIVETIRQSKSPEDTLYQSAVQQLKKQITELEQQGQSTVLQPGNSTVQAFTLRTAQAVLFLPSSYNLNVQVEYEIDGKVNQDAETYRLDVRAPLRALIMGSIIGSTVGYLLRDIYERRQLVEIIRQPTTQDVVSWVVGAVGSVLLGALVVIAFARKKDTQPLLTIEDFWGGIFVGFIAGYAGKSFLEQLVRTGSSGAMPTTQGSIR